MSKQLPSNAAPEPHPKTKKSPFDFDAVIKTGRKKPWLVNPPQIQLEIILG